MIFRGWKLYTLIMKISDVSPCHNVVCRQWWNTCHNAYMLKLNLTWRGKLNQTKIRKTEPMENLHQSLCTFICRKVITHECPCINILSIETSYLNVETEPRTKWCGDGEMENFHLGNGI